MEPRVIVNGIGARAVAGLAGENVLVSPSAVSRDLAVLAGGADIPAGGGRGIAGLLGAGSLADVRRLADALARRTDPGSGDAEVEASDLLVVNTRSGCSVSDVYRGWLDEFDRVGIASFDLSEHLDDARRAISSWASDSTGGHMEGYVPELDGATDIALYDSLHISGMWENGFDQSSTRAGRFTLADSGTIQVMMMRSRGRFRYREDAGYRAVAMDLRGGLAVCAVISADGRPDMGRIWAEEDPGFRSGLIDALLDSPYADVRLSFPRTEVSVRTDLMDILAALGMPDGIELPRIADRPLRLAGGSQAVRLSIGENGLEASAVIENLICRCALMPDVPIDFDVDIPFALIVRDEGNGTDLISGCIGNPGGGRPARRPEHR